MSEYVPHHFSNAWVYEHPEQCCLEPSLDYQVYQVNCSRPKNHSGSHWGQTTLTGEWESHSHEDHSHDGMPPHAH